MAIVLQTVTNVILWYLAMHSSFDPSHLADSETADLVAARHCVDARLSTFASNKTSTVIHRWPAPRLYPL